MDPFRMCLALGPVAIYLLLIGGINMARRPFVVSGTRDTAALGLAVAGLVAVGPIELFFPIAAASYFGALVWSFLMVFYALCLVLVLLLLRPRLVIYNVSIDELRPVLAELVPQLDAEARWAGDGLILPNMGLQLHLENLRPLRNVSLVATGARQNYLGWKRLESALRAALAPGEIRRNARAGRIIGAGFLGAGALVIALLVWAVMLDPRTVSHALFDMLRLHR
jgi:hypothetical protein